MKILFTADWHIKLTAKNVPVEWQKKRFQMLVDELVSICSKNQIDLLLIGGDFYDSDRPTPDEIGFGQTILTQLCEKTKKPLWIFPGNHEMGKSGSKSILSGVLEPLQELLDITLIEEFSSYDGFDILPYNVLKAHKWSPVNGLCFTHVRGNIGGMVESEIPLEWLSGWEMVIAGDLHNTDMSQANIIYPGSPLNTSFSRTRESVAHGALIVDTVDVSAKWVSLDHLPQLIKLTITDKKDIKPTDYDHTVYELEGDLESLKGVKKDPLLSKTINVVKSKDAVIDTRGMSVTEVFVAYWKGVEKLGDETIKSLASKVEKHAPNSD